MSDTLIKGRVTVNLILCFCERNLFQEINNARKMPGGSKRQKFTICLRKHSKGDFFFSFSNLTFFSLQWPDSNNVENLSLLATRRTNYRLLWLANRYLRTEEYTTGTLGSLSWVRNPFSFLCHHRREFTNLYLKSIKKNSNFMVKEVEQSLD